MAGMEVLGWGVVAAALVTKFSRRERLDFPLWIPLVILVLAVLASLLGRPLNRPFSFQMGFMRWIALMWGLYWALSLVWSEKFERRLMWTWAAGLVGAGLYACFQCVTGIDLIRPARGVIVSRGSLFKAVGFFSMSLTFAYSVGMSTLALTLPALKRWGVRGATPIAVLGGLGILTAFSRGGWIALVLVLAFYVLCEFPRYFLPFLAAIVAIVTALVTFSEGFADKIGGLLALQMDHSSSVRLDLWSAYLKMFGDNPWRGVGLFEGDRLLPAYYAALGIEQPFASHAHNVPLQWAAGAGTFALAAYLAFVFGLLKRAWDLRKATPWGWSLLLAQLYLHIGGMTEANFFDGEVNHMAVMIFALTLHFSRMKRD